MTLPQPVENQQHDAGTPVDAGTAQTDAGRIPDAGTKPDAGSNPDTDAGLPADAGNVDAGPQGDIAPPSFNGAASAQAKSETEIEVAWGIATDDTTPAAGIQYLVYLSTNSPVATVGAPNQVLTNVTSFRFTNLIPGTRYFALVRARDEAGNIDNNTREVSATTPDAAPPTVPANVIVTPASAADITVEWDPSTDNGSSHSDINYLVAVSSIAGGTATASPIATQNGVTAQRISGLNPSTTYYVSVRAQDVVGNRSAWSAEVSATTLADTTAPAFSGATGATAIGPNSIRVNWAAASDNATPAAAITYRVYRGATESSIDFGSPVATVTGQVTAVIAGLAQNTEYFFVVRATDASDNTDSNNVVRSARTQADVTAPSFGGVTQVTAISPSELELSWVAATDNVTPAVAMVYDIYIATTSKGQNFAAAPTATSAPGATSYNLSGLSPETRYFVVVRARDGANNRDTNTVEKDATTPAIPDVLPPSFAGVDTVIDKSATSIEAAWTAATDDVSDPSEIVYKVYVATESGAQDFGVPTLTTLAGATSAQVTGLAPETEYFVVVRATDKAGNEEKNTTEKAATTPMAPDTVAPTFAGLETATATTQGSVELTWSAGSDDRTPESNLRYNIYLATASGAQVFTTPEATTTAGATSYTVTGLDPGTTYYFVVRALDEGDNEDTNTTEKSATTSAAPDTTPPTFAGATSATALSSTEIRVEWAAASDNVTAAADIHYDIFVASSSLGQDFQNPTLSTTGGATSATLTGLDPATEYFIVVRARDELGNGESNSVEVSATTLAAPDTTPPTFAGATAATALSSTEIQVEWAAASDDVTAAADIYYDVFAASSSLGQDFQNPTLSITGGATSATLTGLDPATEYFIVVRARDELGNGESNSVEVSATTLP